MRRETDLCFFCPFFAPSRPLLPPRRTGTGRQAERGKITPWNVASGIFFVTLCDLRYVLLIFCIINLLNYFFSIFLMFRGPSWDAPLLFLCPSLSPIPYSRWAGQTPESAERKKWDSLSQIVHFFRNFALHIHYIDTHCINVLFYISSPEARRETHLCFFYPSTRQDRGTPTQKAKREKNNWWNCCIWHNFIVTSHRNLWLYLTITNYVIFS